MRFALVCSSMQRLYVPAGIFLSSALYVCSAALVIVIQGEEYRDAIGLLRVLCWSVALMYCWITADTAFMAADRMRVKLILQVCATFVVFVSSLLFIPRYWAMGASYTRLLGDFFFLALGITYAYTKKLYPFPRLLSISLPTVITVLTAITLTKAMPSRHFLAPSLFFLSSCVIWYPFLRPRIHKSEQI
jgi:O-antigen/teichoic acid export membrane protein